LKKDLGIDAKLVESSGGAFEVTADGELIYSKLKTGDFPEDDDIVRMLGRRSRR
jgi:selenoprotein W-related protein